MCGWLSLTQKSSIGSCRWHWIRSQEISFDKPIVFAPKSPDTPKGNRESFFRVQTLWEHTLHWKNFNEPDMIRPPKSFHRRGSTLQSLQLFQASWCTTIWSASSKAVAKAETVVWKGWETDPLCWVCRQPVFPLCWLRNGSFLKAWVPHGAMNGSRDQAWHDAKLRKLEVWWVCCITVAGCCSCFALCGSWFFEVYLGVFQSTLRLFWSTDPKERPGTFS